MINDRLYSIIITAFAAGLLIMLLVVHSLLNDHKVALKNCENSLYPIKVTIYDD